MKAVRLHAYGGPEVLTHEDAPAPEPGPGEVRVRVRAAGINPFDWKVRQGWFKDMMPLLLPAVLGADFAGVVDAVGPGVTAFSPGDEVFGAAEMGRAGSYAELALASVEKIAAKPKTMDFERAASVPTPAITAWEALFEAGGLTSGQTVLIHGIGGAVGRMALQLAKHAGARVLGTVSASARDELLKLGADEVIDYRTARFEDVARDVDLVLDTVGGETQARSFGVLKRGGALVSLIAPPSEEAAKQHGVRATVMYAQPKRALYEQIAARIDEGKLHVRPAVVVPLAEAVTAHAMAESGKAHKVVLRVGA